MLRRSMTCRIVKKIALETPGGAAVLGRAINEKKKKERWGKQLGDSNRSCSFLIPTLPLLCTVNSAVHAVLRQYFETYMPTDSGALHARNTCRKKKNNNLLKVIRTVLSLSVIVLFDLSLN